MKFAIPEISWHNRDPVLSVDFQPKAAVSDPKRLATGGTDSHVLIWYISTTDTGSVNLEVAADLNKHQKAVNVVRWSPSGEFLASGDDESIIFIWKQKNEEPVPTQLENGEEIYKETWVVHKTLRGHMEDVLDISWSSNSLHLASGSVDNKLIIWDVNRGKYSNILTDHKGFVQGVAWDPKSQLLASTSTDRVFRTFDIASKKVTSRSSKAVLPFPKDHPLHNVRVRLYYDDTLQTYFRRLQFSPDGLLLAVPAGRIEPETGMPGIKPINAVYIYTRYSLKGPAVVLPCGEEALVTRWSPCIYALRPGGPGPALGVPYRMLLAVGTKRSVLLYDTQQKTPIAMISNIHYTRLTDLTWSPNGCTLVASSTDGYCSVIMFGDKELGDVLPETVPEETIQPESMEISDEAEPPKEKTEEPKVTKTKIDSFIKFNTPSAPKTRKTEDQKIKTPVKLDVLVETAMQSWSDNSNNEIIKPTEKKQEPVEIMEIEDSEDIKLVYEDSQSTQSKDDNKTEKLIEKKSPEENKSIKDKESPERKPESPKQVTTPTNFMKQAKVTDMKQQAVTAGPSPKAPRRVSFVTLSSPKNKKKC